MHEPDKEPDTKIITNKRFTVQWLANISLGGGLLVSIIGSLVAIGTRQVGFFSLSLPGLFLAIVTCRIAKTIPDERAHNTAALSIVLNAVLFLVLFIIFIFMKEAGQAI